MKYTFCREFNSE